VLDHDKNTRMITTAQYAQEVISNCRASTQFRKKRDCEFTRKDEFTKARKHVQTVGEKKKVQG
jgi:hypothetical protein